MSSALPNEWFTSALGDLARVYSGGTPLRSVPAYWGGRIPWVTTAEIDERLIGSTRETITDAGLNASAARVASRGTLLLAMYGQGKTRGKVGMLGIAAAMNQACAAIEAGRHLNARYLFHYLASQYDSIRSMSNAGSQENLSGELVRKIPVLVPPIPEQRAIGHVLDDADGLISALQRQIAKKMAFKQGLMQQLLTGALRPSGVDAPWTRRRISELIDALTAGVSVRSTADHGAGPSILKTSSIHKGRFIPSEAKPILHADLTRARIHPEADSLIISRMNTPVLVGDVGYVPDAHPELFLPDRLWLARRKKGTNTDMRWLAYLLASEPGARLLRGLATGTSGSMKNIPKGHLLDLEIAAPSVPEQRHISAILADADDEIDAIQRRCVKARDMKQGMMQQLLTGRTRLPVTEVAA